MKKGILQFILILACLPGFSQELFENFTFEVARANDSMFVVSLVEIDNSSRVEKALRYPPTNIKDTRELLNAIREKKLAKVGEAKFAHLSALAGYEATGAKIDTLGVKGYERYVKSALEPKYDGNWVFIAGGKYRMLEIKGGKVMEDGLEVGSINVKSTREITFAVDEAQFTMYSENGVFFLAKKGSELYRLLKIEKKEDEGE